MALVAGLRPHRQQRVARHQPLTCLVIDQRRGDPGRRLPRGGQTGEVPRVERVGLRPAQLRLGAVVRLAGVDDGDALARLVQRDGEGDPRVAGRLQHDERLRRRGRGLEPPLEGDEPRRRLLAGERDRRRAARWQPRCGERIRGDVDADVAPIWRACTPPSLLPHHAAPWRQVPRDGGGLRS